MLISLNQSFELNVRCVYFSSFLLGYIGYTVRTVYIPCIYWPARWEFLWEIQVFVVVCMLLFLWSPVELLLVCCKFRSLLLCACCCFSGVLLNSCLSAVISAESECRKRVHQHQIRNTGAQRRSTQNAGPAHPPSFYAHAGQSTSQVSVTADSFWFSVALRPQWTEHQPSKCQSFMLIQCCFSSTVDRAPTK